MYQLRKLASMFWNTLRHFCPNASAVCKRVPFFEAYNLSVPRCWEMVAHPVTQVIGEQAFVDILDLSWVASICWGRFYTQQWAGAEDGEEIRPVAVTGNE